MSDTMISVTIMQKLLQEQAGNFEKLLKNVSDISRLNSEMVEMRKDLTMLKEGNDLKDTLIKSLQEEVETLKKQMAEKNEMIAACASKNDMGILETRVEMVKKEVDTCASMENQALNAFGIRKHADTQFELIGVIHKQRKELVARQTTLEDRVVNLQRSFQDRLLFYIGCGATLLPSLSHCSDWITFLIICVVIELDGVFMLWSTHKRENAVIQKLNELATTDASLKTTADTITKKLDLYVQDLEINDPHIEHLSSLKAASLKPLKVRNYKNFYGYMSYIPFVALFVVVIAVFTRQIKRCKPGFLSF